MKDNDATKVYSFFDDRGDAISYKDVKDQPGCCQPTKTKCVKIEDGENGEKRKKCTTQYGMTLCKEPARTIIKTCEQLKAYTKKKYEEQEEEIEHPETEETRKDLDDLEVSVTTKKKDDKPSSLYDNPETADDNDEKKSTDNTDIGKKEMVLLINELNKPQDIAKDDSKCPPR